MDERNRELRWLATDELFKEPPFPSRQGNAPASAGLLLSSIRLHGVLSPLLVRPCRSGYQVVCGYRRLLAARKAGIKDVPVMVCRLGDVEAIRYYLSENTCRRELSDSARNETLSLLRQIRDGIDVPVGESGEALATEKEEGELWTPTWPESEGTLPIGRKNMAERWDIDNQVEEAAAAATILDLIERTERFLDNVRIVKRIEMHQAREIVDDLMALPESFQPLTPAQVYSETRDSWLGQHCLLSASLNAELSPHGVPEPGRYGYALAGLLHDVGMVFLDPAAFQDNRDLEPSQKRAMQGHTRLGHALILEQGKDYAEIALVARDHHERVDGSGYPNGLRGNELGQLVRATSLVDAYASLTGYRPHRRALRPKIALRRLAQATEKGLFDPTLFPALHKATQLEPAGSPLPSSGESSPRWTQEKRKTSLAVDFY